MPITGMRSLREKLSEEKAKGKKSCETVPLYISWRNRLAVWISNLKTLYVIAHMRSN
jgi:hypothetical protein